MSRIMLSCGEASGDLYAAALARELLARDPGARITGFGGPRLREAVGALHADYRDYSVTGLVEVVRMLPRTWALYRSLVRAAAQGRPDVFVAIDFPDFNFRLGAALHRLGIPVVYYIGPQLWAWRPGRLQTMKRFVDRVLVIFPFEEAIYREAGVPVEFVGHPLVDLIGGVEGRERLLARLSLDPAAPTVALLPGSRPNEVHHILPGLLRGASLIARDEPRVQFVVARAPNLENRLFDPLNGPEAAGLRLAVVERETDSVLNAADVVVTASGTATVQTALHERPMVIVYRLAPLTYRLGIRFVRVSTYGMVNLVAGRRVAPELIQDDFTPEAVASETLRLLRDSDARARTQEALREVKRRLGGGGASGRAAETILAVARARDGAGVSGGAR